MVENAGNILLPVAVYLVRKVSINCGALGAIPLAERAQDTLSPAFTSLSTCVYRPFIVNMSCISSSLMLLGLETSAASVLSRHSNAVALGL